MSHRDRNGGGGSVAAHDSRQDGKASIQADKVTGGFLTPGARTDFALLREMHRQVHTMHVTHRRAEAEAARNGRIIGLGVAVLAAVTGTSIFATLQGNPAVGWRITVGIIAIATAALGAIQSSLAFGQQQAQHRSAAEAYGKLRRDLEMWVLGHPGVEVPGAESGEWLKGWCERWNDAEAGAPAVSNRLYKKAEDDVKGREML